MKDDLDELERDLAPVLSRTLHAVAESAVPAVGLTRRRRLGRMVATGATGVVMIAGMAAWNLRDPGEIERVPVETALMSGVAEGGRWWLLPSVHDRCGRPASGVEFVSDATNKPGLEWNTGGVAYGEPSSSLMVCDQQPDESAWLRDPTRAAMSYTKVGFEREGYAWGFYGAFHPTVAAIEVGIDGTEPFVVRTLPTPDRVDGPRYTAFTVPATASVVRTRFMDANREPIPGSAGVRHLPR